MIVYECLQYFIQLTKGRGDRVYSCYTGKLLQLRFLKNCMEDSRSCELCCVKSISNQLCMQNLEMIDGNKKQLWPKIDFYLSE